MVRTYGFGKLAKKIGANLLTATGDIAADLDHVGRGCDPLEEEVVIDDLDNAIIRLTAQACEALIRDREMLETPTTNSRVKPVGGIASDFFAGRKVDSRQEVPLSDTLPRAQDKYSASLGLELLTGNKGPVVKKSK